MTESRQDPAMRRRHIENALREMREASVRLGNARDWLFDLDYMPLRADVAKVKDQLLTAIVKLDRLLDREAR